MNVKKIVVGLISALCMALPAAAQDHENVELVGTVYNNFDHAYSVVVEDSLAYVASGNTGLLIVDISNTDNPQLVGY